MPATQSGKRTLVDVVACENHDKLTKENNYLKRFLGTSS